MIFSESVTVLYTLCIKGLRLLTMIDYNNPFLLTGGVWVVKVTIIEGADAGETLTVGRIMFEGDGRGMNRLGMFDEMIGCVKCNAIHHKDTRFGPYVLSEDNSIRMPVKMFGKARAGKSRRACNKYSITGDRFDSSISFESGPLMETPSPKTKKIKRKRIW